jgi:hypothetical protein
MPGRALKETMSSQIWQLKVDAPPTLLLRSKTQDYEHIQHSIAALPGNTLAAGSNSGAIHFYSARDDELQCSTILQACT